MLHVVYVSTATRPFTLADADEVLSAARAFNATLDVTGLLVHARGSFLQVLEAEHECMALRGARTAGSRTTTSALRGVLRDDPRRRDEFLAQVRRR